MSTRDDMERIQNLYQYQTGHNRWVQDEIRHWKQVAATLIRHLYAEGFDAYVSDIDLAADPPLISTTYNPATRLYRLTVDGLEIKDA